MDTKIHSLFCISRDFSLTMLHGSRIQKNPSEGGSANEKGLEGTHFLSALIARK